MPDINTDGLLALSTNNTTWVAPSENFPVTLSNQQRGGVMVITGAAGDQLLDINGRLLQDGSIVFNQAEYTEGQGIVRAANTYFRYLSADGEDRDAQGLMPNVSANWQALNTGGGTGGTFTVLDDIDALKKLKRSFDYIFFTGHAFKGKWSLFMNALRPKGRLHFLGLLSEPLNISMFNLLRGQNSISASPVGGPEAMKRMLDFCNLHSITPEVEFFKMSDINKAIERLKSGEARYRLVLEN